MSIINYGYLIKYPQRVTYSDGKKRDAIVTAYADKVSEGTMVVKVVSDIQPFEANKNKRINEKAYKQEKGKRKYIIKLLYCEEL